MKVTTYNQITTMIPFVHLTSTLMIMLKLQSFSYSFSCIVCNEEF